MKADKAAPDTAEGEAGQARKKKRKRLSGVRNRVLELLGTGPMTSTQLVESGGFSSASLYLNLRGLKKDGLVSTKRNGRSVMIKLTGKSPEPTAASGGRARKGRGRGGRVDGDLHRALQGLARRLSPVDRLKDKLLVLEQLSQTMPAPVSKLLREIMGDLGSET